MAKILEVLSDNLPFELVEAKILGVNFKQGALNLMQPIVLKDGRRAFWRQPKSIDQITTILQGINYEYQQVGFMANRGRWRLRTLHEQAEFAARCRKKDLPVAGVEMLEGDFAVVPVVEGEVLANYLKNGTTSGEVVQAFLNSVVGLHSAGIIAGDRWTKNALVTTEGVIHIDFDIELGGEMAPEFELAQAMYYASLTQDGKMREVVERWKSDVLSRKGAYHLEMVDEFLRNHWQLAGKYPQMNP